MLPIDCTGPVTSAAVVMHPHWSMAPISTTDLVKYIWRALRPPNVRASPDLHRPPSFCFVSTAKCSGVPFGNSFSTKAIRFGMARVILSASFFGIRFG